VFAASRSIETRFLPKMTAEQRERKCRGWSEAVRRTLLRAA